jgi:hypothetical protein
VGHAGVACAWDSIVRGPAGELICTFSVLLSGAQITTAGLVDLASATTPGATFTLPIVGGTASFQGAEGEVSVTVVNQTDSIDRFILQ